MIDLLGKTQQELLRLLHKHKGGLTTAELIELLGVTRNAVKQHLSALEKNNLVKPGISKKTAGRPTLTYVLTDAAQERFPRQYSWFAELLLSSLRSEKDEKGLKAFLENLALSISSKYLPELQKLKPRERLMKTALILSELGYEAEVTPSKEKSEISKLEVSNCVFYQLTQSCPEMCRFDLRLLTELTGQKLEQQSCIAGGSGQCCFGVKK